MIGGFAAISREQYSIATKVSNTKTKGISTINLCRIDNIYDDKMTADIFLPEDNAYAFNVPLSFPSKGYGYGSYLMPKKGTLALAVVTTYGRMFVLASSCVSDNFTDQRAYAGENLIIAEGGAFMKQDYIGNNVVSSGSGNLSVYNNNMSNSEVSTGKEEFNVSSKVIKGLSFDVNKIANSFLKTNNVKVVNYEECYRSVETINTYASADILKNNIIDENIKTEILNVSNDVIMKLTDFIAQCREFDAKISTMGSDVTAMTQYADSFKASLKDKFSIKKKPSVIIQKGNVISKHINNITDTYNLKDTDFQKSEDGNDLVYKIAVLNPNTEEELAYIAIDAVGIGYMKFKDLKIITEGGTL